MLLLAELSSSIAPSEGEDEIRRQGRKLEPLVILIINFFHFLERDSSLATVLKVEISVSYLALKAGGYHLVSTCGMITVRE